LFLAVPWTPPPLPTGLADRLALILEGLCQALAAHAVKDRSTVPLIVLAWTRLRRLSVRFARLAAAVRAGRLASAPAPRRPPAAPAPALPRLPALPQPYRLPRGFGWLLRLVPDAAVHRGQIEHWLAEPELAALLGEAPRAGRILRALCGMLGIRPGPALRARCASAILPAAPARQAALGPRFPDAPLGSSPRAGSSEPERPTGIGSTAEAGAGPPLALSMPG
jgi:hypothetical protein